MTQQQQPKTAAESCQQEESEHRVDLHVDYVRVGEPVLTDAGKAIQQANQGHVAKMNAGKHEPRGHKPAKSVIAINNASF